MSFLDELKQRRVIRVAVGYVVASWIAIQAASISLPAFAAPEWTLRAFILLFVLGFPLALFLSWALDVTPEGIKPSPSSLGNTLLALVVIAGMTTAIGWYFFHMPGASRSQAPAIRAAITPATITPATITSAAPSPPAVAPGAPAAKEAAATPRTVPGLDTAPAATSASPAPASAAPQGAPARATPAVGPGTASGEKATPTLAHCQELARTLHQQAMAEVRRHPLAQRQKRRAAMTTLREAGCLEP
jgi:hypothetical protein